MGISLQLASTAAAENAPPCVNERRGVEPKLQRRAWQRSVSVVCLAMLRQPDSADYAGLPHRAPFGFRHSSPPHRASRICRTLWPSVPAATPGERRYTKRGIPSQTVSLWRRVFQPYTLPLRLFGFEILGSWSFELVQPPWRRTDPFPVRLRTGAQVSKTRAVTIRVEALYDNGVVRPVEPDSGLRSGTRHLDAGTP